MTGKIIQLIFVNGTIRVGWRHQKLNSQESEWQPSQNSLELYECPSLRQVSQIKAPFLVNAAYTQNSFRKPLWNLIGQLGLLFSKQKTQKSGWRCLIMRAEWDFLISLSTLLLLWSMGYKFGGLFMPQHISLSILLLSLTLGIWCRGKWPNL